MVRFFWDTNHYIYLFEGHAIFEPPVVRLRQRMLVQGDELLTSAVTLGEIQVKALRESRTDLAAELKRRVLATSQIVPFDGPAADAFAQIRTTTNVKGADAIHIACAMIAGVDFFITNDTDLHKLKFSGIGKITSAFLMPVS